MACPVKRRDDETRRKKELEEAEKQATDQIHCNTEYKNNELVQH